MGALVDSVGRTLLTPAAPLLDTLESRFFALAPVVAACPVHAATYVALHGRMREAVKRRSVDWDLSIRETRDRLYRALYGGRAAVEAVMIQHPGEVSTILQGSPAPSATPSATPSAVTQGIALHSGDIIVSRGGYPTSALIARGNDYPGNFSHIALVHVDETTREVSVLEAHIESGVSISTVERYLADKKLRLMLLRPRAGAPALVRDPQLPHRAATAMLARARAGHIPYDFSMDYTESERLFCSEVASSVYRDQGLTLWTGLSTISAPGLRRWLAAFGVRHFETQEPSDLEYDPQLDVVAEWHDSTALFDDQLDNAVTDVMLEGAERGDALRYAWYALPAARIAKAYSWLRERAGGIGPVPEGMSAEGALRSRAYSARHDALVTKVHTAAAAWRRERGYAPPYWTLVALARNEATR